MYFGFDFVSGFVTDEGGRDFRGIRFYFLLGRGFFKFIFCLFYGVKIMFRVFRV